MTPSNASRCSPSWASVLLVLLLTSTATAKPDAGITAKAQAPARGPTADRTADAGVAPQAPHGLAVTDAGAATQPVVPPADWKGDQIRAIQSGIEALDQQAKAIAGIKKDSLVVPKELVPLFRIDLRDPGAAQRRARELLNRKLVTEAQIDERQARLKLIQPLLLRPIRKVARYKKRRRRPPRSLVEQATEAQKRLDLLRLEHQILVKRYRWLAVMEDYLASSQPFRVAADRERRRSLAEKAARERQAAAQAQQLARAAEHDAQAAQKAALKKKHEARSELGRLIAGEEARLQGVRAKQAQLEHHLAQQLDAVGKLRTELETFRGQIAARGDALKESWPKSAPSYDALYDEVVAKLVLLRPRALEDLWTSIRGIPPAPTPAEMAPRLWKLAKSDSKLQQLRQFSDELEKAATRLEENHGKLILRRLALLQNEVTWLNEHRTRLLAFATADKRDDLAWWTAPETWEQFGREVSQLVFDAVYWSYQRLRQIDQVPKLIVDIFTVGSLLWMVVRVLFLLLLLRYVLKRWDHWLKAAVPAVARSVELGSYALPLAKLTDTARFAGPSLLVWIVVAVLYRMLGGTQAAAEVHVVYVIVFWWAIYRFQLRVVEVGARYAGLGRVMDQIERERRGEIDPALEGPPAPENVEGPAPPPELLAKAEKHKPAAEVIPAATLAVRSVRAATRYMLAVLIVLELTAIAVGKGTIYLLTVKFSWWAALPFIYYFLKLWRPHIISAYQRLTEGRESRRLRDLVDRSEHRAYGVFLVGVAFCIVFANRLARFARRYLTNLDMTKRLLAFLFRRRVAKHAEQAGRVVARREDLPEVLLAQFPTAPIDRRDGAMVPPSMAAIKETFEVWQKQRADGSVALVGAAGMGKSTVLRLLEKELKTPTIRGDLRTKITRQAKLVSWLSEVFAFSPRPSSEQELIRMIREDNRPIVALDNCHNLFLRRVGGFEAWDAFVRIVNETCDNVFWIMTYNAAAWDYLFNAGGQVEYFRRTIAMAPWTEKHIHRLTLLRMARAGYGVSFSDLIVANVPDSDLGAHAGRTSAGYFRMLWDFTGGNPRLAGQFWLDSLVPEKDRREVRVHLFDEPKIDDLVKLPMDTVFILTAVAEHENLSAADAADTTRLPVDYCRFAINACLEEGYLHRVDPQRVRLSHRWQRTILRLLRRRHLIHDTATGAPK